jgi:hypothetical protein
VTDKARIAEIRAQISAIAPVPNDGPVDAATMARNLAVCAQERWTRQFAGAGMDRDQAVLICTEFAAATALYALAASERPGPELPLGVEPAIPQVVRDMKPGNVAAWIRACQDDGSSVGEFLYEFLGAETHAEVVRLAGEMAEAAAQEPAATVDDAEPGTPYHDTLTAFRRSLIESHLMWDGMQEPYRAIVMAWHAEHRENPETPRPPEPVMDAYAATMMAANYAYAIAAMIKVAQRDLGADAAARIAGAADDILTNGDFDALNADVFRTGEQPGSTARGLEFTIGTPAPASEAVTSGD